mmetsp:Transcript_18021/g.54171  ORF Transcript_18021/g.54171 Transcript_18021/m.54171 type:complete len:587 (-) Transcript_18021:690-2450(-)
MDIPQSAPSRQRFLDVPSASPPQIDPVVAGSSPSRRLTPKLVRRLVTVARDQRKCQFAGFDDEGTPTEKAVMHLYDAERNLWVEEVALVKVEPEKFAEGALRECFRAKLVRGKELSTLGKARCWEQATRWVAKRYKPDKSPEDPRVGYMEDVQLQMISKHYGELFNQHHPPKKVDFLQAFLLECFGRKDRTLYCVEAYLPGEYVKYTNNTGFFDVEHMRNTPQAFSHFTFVESKGDLLICDIQGVSDLYTDPAIHTADKKHYGAGNLGHRGMALFLYSHECNFVCRQLKLTPFEHAKTKSKKHLEKFFEVQRKLNNQSLSDSFRAVLSASPPARIGPSPMATGFLEAPSPRKNVQLTAQPMSDFIVLPLPDLIPVSVSYEAAVHLTLATLHEEGRIARLDDSFHREAEHIEEVTPPSLTCAWFHYQKAAHLGHSGAQLAVASVLANMPRDHMQHTDCEDRDLANKYLELAAERGDYHARFHCAQNAQFDEPPKLKEALDWYMTLLEATPPDPEEEAYGWTVTQAPFEIKAALASLLKDGGAGLEANRSRAAELWNEAAEEAMSSMKGKLATKYYALAAECDYVSQS